MMHQNCEAGLNFGIAFLHLAKEGTFTVTNLRVSL